MVIVRPEASGKRLLSELQKAKDDGLKEKGDRRKAKDCAPAQHAFFLSFLSLSLFLTLARINQTVELVDGELLLSFVIITLVSWARACLVIFSPISASRATLDPAVKMETNRK